MSINTTEIAQPKAISSPKHSGANENLWQAVLFAVAISYFAVFSLANCITQSSHRQISEIENRALSDFPALPLAADGMAKFFIRLEAFYNDRFFSRLELQKIRSLLLYKLMQTSSSDAVVLGKKEWLYYFTENLSSNDAFNEIQLKNWAQLFQTRSELLNANGIKYILMIVPEKSTIYPEYLSSSLAEIKRASRFEELENYLEKTSVCVVNPRQSFDFLKTKHNIYYKTDSHWTDYGAMVASSLLAKKLFPSFPAIERRRSELAAFQQTNFSGDLAKMLNLKGIINEKVESLNFTHLQAKAELKQSKFVTAENDLEKLTTTNNSDFPKVFVMHDSFGLNLAPFISEFSRQANFKRTQTLPIEQILAARPDFVIDEIAERHLYTLGHLQQYRLGTYPYFPVKQEVFEANNTPAELKAALATSDKTLAIESTLAIQNGRKVDLSIDWQSTAGGVLNEIIGINIMDSRGVSISSAEYAQNPAFIDFPRQARWRDRLTLQLPGDSSRAASVSVCVYKTKEKPEKVRNQSVVKKNTRRCSA